MKSLLNWVRNWPSACAVCARWPSDAICSDCRDRHGRVVLRCPGCALPMANGLSLCHRCNTQPSQTTTPSYLQGAVCQHAARVDYAYPWSEAVARLKHDPAQAMPLAKLMWQSPDIRALVLKADVISPIPLGSRKLRDRGFNQSWELIKALKRHGTITAHAHASLLHRTDQTADQHTLPRHQRLLNARHAFQAPPATTALIRERHVLLVDDVMTTGATLQAAAQTLLEAGARQVSALVFARTPDSALD